MGSSSSKDGGGVAAAASSSSAGPGVRRTRSMGTRVFQTSCLGRPSFESDNDLLDSNNNRNKVNGSLSDEDHQTTKEEEEEGVGVEGDEELGKSHQLLKQQQSRRDDPEDVKIDDRSSSQHDRSTRHRSRFSFIPGNISFRLNRAASFGSSSSSYSLFSNNATPAPNAELQAPPSMITNQGRDSHPVPEFDSSSSLLPHPHNDDPIVSNQDNDVPIINNESTGILPDADHHTATNEDTDTEFIQSIRANRRTGAREPVERSVRFSRTLSVGRLRDRVLRRSSFTDGLFGRLQQDREVGDSSQENERQVWGGMTTRSHSDGNADISPTPSTHPLSSVSSSLYNNQDDELDTSRPREARYHDIMEHRTDFLERRRRIRSQVRALQRLGSRFENLSGHERSCILAGQHRSGRCTCRTSNRTRNPDDDTSAGASISRIVMLAEALFEVLDEIHQQSVVLSSRPSVSSLGSIPAPKEIVESMPVKIYAKLQKHQLEDVAQCYICLVEYEEGDCMRILPCQHEFHRTCIDKWLKEIHRVCPLCRGDVCRSSDSCSASEN